MEIRMKVLRSSAAALLAILGTIVGSTLAQTKDSAAPILSEQVTKCDDLVKLSPPDVTDRCFRSHSSGRPSMQETSPAWKFGTQRPSVKVKKRAISTE